jgi:hypothetical protein
VIGVAVGQERTNEGDDATEPETKAGSPETTTRFGDLEQR